MRRLLVFSRAAQIAAFCFWGDSFLGNGAPYSGIGFPDSADEQRLFLAPRTSRVCRAVLLEDALDCEVIYRGPHFD